MKADCDISTGLALFVLLALRERRALGAFVAVATVQPLFDLTLSLTDARGRAAYTLAVHGGAAVLCAILEALLLRRPRPTA